MENPPAKPHPLLGTLEIGRFIAASAVVCSHAIPQLGRIGPPAVQYFFVLSGFVMMTAHQPDFGRPGAAQKFWWRRARRIFPCYWLALLIALPLAAPAQWQDERLALITLAPVHVPFEPVYPAWTLRFEMAFYLAFGLCLLPKIGRALLALWVLGVAAHMLWRHLPTGALGDFLSIVDVYFFAGLLAGWVFARHPPLLSAWGLLGTGLAVLAGGLAVTHGSIYEGPSAMTLLFAAAFAAIILGLAALERRGQVRPGAWAKTLGAMSYPLYILHAPLLLALARLGPANLAAVFALCALASFAFDQPVQRILRK